MYGFPAMGYQMPFQQNQMEQLQNQYNALYQQQAQPQIIKGRPVSNYDEAKAAMIDLDGSLFMFPDVANKKIYTKQIMLDGTAELKTYVLQEQNSSNGYVTQSDLKIAMNQLRKELGGVEHVTADVPE